MQHARNILSSAPFLIPLVSGSSPSFLYILRIPLRSAFPSFRCASRPYDIPLTIPASFPLLRYDSYVTIPFLPALTVRFRVSMCFPSFRLFRISALSLSSISGLSLFHCLLSI